VKRFVCGSIIPGCDGVFTGPGDQSVLDQALEHAAVNHGLAAAPMPFIELVLTYTLPFVPTANRGHLRVVDRADVPSGATNGPSPDGGAALPAAPDEAPHLHVVGRPCPATDGNRSRWEGTGHDRLLHGPGRGRLRPSEAHDTYRHECLLYAGTDGFLDAVVPFVRDGLARQEAVLVAVAEPRLAAVRSALAGDAERVMFADMADLGHNPALIIPAWRDFIERFGGVGHPVRGVGEPIWASRHREVIIEAQLHEALLNVAVSPDIPLWLLCPYDTVALDEQVIVEATRAHPVLVESNSYCVSHRYGGASHAGRLFCSPRGEPRGAVTPIRFDRADHGHVGDILAFAATAGVRIDRAVKLAAAIDQVAAAADQVSPDVDIRVWSEPAALICEVTDAATEHDPMVGRGVRSHSARDRAVRLANGLCDLVQVRSGRTGTATRVWCWR
jgi:hypothetical protein